MADNNCFCCDKVVKPALRKEDPWEAPGHALRFTGDGTFGSAVFDSIMQPEGTVIQILICDDCLKDKSYAIRKMKYTRKTISEEVKD